jgi:hypothetical protein
VSKRVWVVELIAKTADIPYGVAESVVDRLMEEGLLSLGYGDKDVDAIVVTFADTFGTTKTSRQDRFAAHRLAKEHGSQAVVGIIRLLAQHSTEKFAPVVNSVAQLEDKMPSVLNFLRKTGDSEVIDA